MKKLIMTFCALALTLTVTNAQTTQGTMTFGWGTEFLPSDAGNTVNVGYFVKDGIMVSAEFNMVMADETDMNWGIGARYYVGDDGMWAGLTANNADGDGVDVEDGMDMWLGAGYSKALALDGKLWFEPTIGYSMPNVGDGSIGMGMGFRLAF